MKLNAALSLFLLTNCRGFSPSIHYSRYSTHVAPTTSSRSNELELQAFKLPEGQESNMFEGPTPLVRERDACGVGFIANTSEAGTLYIAIK